MIQRAVDTLPGDPDLRARAVQLLLEEAKRLDATELRKVTRHLLTLLDPAGDERREEKALDRLERAAHLGRHLTITDDQAGGAWITGRCSSEDAALPKATLIPLCGHHHRLVHQAPWEIRRDGPGGFSFTAIRDVRPLGERNTRPPPDD